jgi:hypothetical protein
MSLVLLKNFEFSELRSRKAAGYCECGRRIQIFFASRQATGRDRYHVLCQQCWQRERDRLRVDREGES